MRSSTAFGLAAARGRLTSMPRYIIGAVSMKISRSTSTTSTSGMMLISARLEPIRRGPSDGPALNAILLHGPRELGGGTTHHVEHVEAEAFHLGCPVLHAIDEIVVAHDGGDRGAETGRGRDERFRDAGRDDREARRALRADAVERVHHADDGAEQPDERARAGGR